MRGSAGDGEQILRGDDHDEAGDDEEEVDAGRPRQEEGGGEARPGLERGARGVVLDVMNTTMRRRGAQDLDGDEVLGPFAGAQKSRSVLMGYCRIGQPARSRMALALAKTSLNMSVVRTPVFVL